MSWLTTCEFQREELEVREYLEEWKWEKLLERDPNFWRRERWEKQSIGEPDQESRSRSEGKKRQGLVGYLEEEVRVVRGRMGRYEVVDFVLLLNADAISGEKSLSDFYQAVAP
jgi:hypothetical protein